jgi:alkylation response protein AidB-like acyl-CoA dehydrogenase
MMDFTLTEDQRSIAAMVRELMVEKVGPRAQEIDEKAELPLWVVDLFRGLDIFGVVVPEEYGGLDGALVTLCAVQEQIARVSPACSMILGVQGLGSTPILLFGSEEQKQRWLPAFATGEKMTAFGLTEPNAGSDVKGMTTRAVKEAGGWRLNGRKCFISHANIADVVVTFAKVKDHGGHDRITAFLVETDQPGYTVDKIEHKMGLRGSATCSFVLEDAWVPDENLLGKVGHGLDVLLGTLHKSRIGSAAQSLGVAQGALDIAAAYVQEREQFGRVLAKMQTVQLIVGGMVAQIEAARALIYAGASRYDQGAPKPELEKFSAAAKLFASDTAMKVSTDAVQVMGGYGYCVEYGAERFMRDAKVFQIFEGANELHQMQAARLLFTKK